LSFGEVIGRLVAVGVESYFADYRGGVTTYYTSAGEFCSKVLPTPAVEIPMGFDADGVRSAIRGAQSGSVKYPEFVELTMAAGCVGYVVWIAGRHVCYLGRKGEQH